MFFASRKNYKKFEHTHGISRSVKNQKLWKNARVHFRFISMFGLIGTPRKLLGWFYNCLIWKVMLLFGLPDGAKWNNKSPMELGIWKLGYRRTAPESETTRVIQSVWSIVRKSLFPYMISWGGVIRYCKPLHREAAVTRVNLVEIQLDWQITMCLEAYHIC